MATTGPHTPEDTHPLYQEVIDAIKADPQAIIRERRIEQLMSFKLMLPDLIWAAKRNRRNHYELYETAKEQVDKRRGEIELEVKEKTDPAASNKPLFRNKEKRDVEVTKILESDPTFKRYDAQRRRMYAQAKQLEDEIDNLERYDHSMIEILAMITALIEFETRFGGTFNELSVKSRSSSRARQRAKTSAGVTPDSLTTAS